MKKENCAYEEYARRENKREPYSTSAGAYPFGNAGSKKNYTSEKMLLELGNMREEIPNSMPIVVN